jgi:hypothetical protein
VRAQGRLGVCLGLAVLLAVLLAAAPARAGFGIQSFSTEALNRDGTLNLQAGTHPYEFQVSFSLNQTAEEPEGRLSAFVADLPPGFIGNPRAVPRCPAALFEGSTPKCPGDSQVGIADVQLLGSGTELPVFNLTPPQGVAASIGFTLASVNSFQEASLRASDYGVSVSDITLPTDIFVFGATETIWGVPADPAHDAQRHCIENGSEVIDCASGVEPVPFLSLPTSCTGPLQTTFTVESLEEPGVPQSMTAESLGEGGTPEGLSGCERPDFDPTIVAQPETSTSDSPTGLHFGLHLPQNNELGKDAEGTLEGTATAHLKDAVVTLPKGLALNPSTAEGLGACSLAQIELKGPQPAQCPASSKVGNVVAQTPLLDHPVSGSVFIARQSENPFGSLIALYIALHDPVTGVVVKLAGKVEPDPVTGQLRTSFKDNPQLPVEDFDFDFFGGPRAALTTPPTCGSYNTTAQLTPWTAPEGQDASLSAPLHITSAPGGGCPGSEAQMPHAPSLEAGTAMPLAGAYSPFVLRLNRENGSQRLAALNTTLPPGVAANFTGVAECSEAQIAQAAARSNPGQGALEKASPSCPQASQIGVVNVGAGSGSPLFVQGSVYLAGPYKGAPFSLAIVTPAVTGPFDLGTVVVRAALYVDEETGQGTVKSDPLPTILQGIPIDVRTIAVKIDRSGYVLNPTSCEEKAITAEAISTTGALAPLKNRFQVGGCKGLDYTPELSLRMNGATRRSGHPALKAVLTQPSGQANSRRTVVILPPTTFIDQNHIANPCTRPQFAAGKCPPASVLGKARVFTPLFENPLEGPVYFRANGGERDLPDVVVDLHGRVHVIAVGFVDAVTRKGSESSRVRTTFANLPDAPISKAIFEFKGGKKGVFVNSANLCKVANTATVKMTAHNNKSSESNHRIATSCSKKK